MSMLTHVARLAQCVVVTTAVGCATRPAAAPEPSATSVVTARRAGVIPQSVGSFRLVQVRAVQGAPLDTMYRFVKDSGQYITVIRYDIPVGVQGGADTVLWLQREGEKFPMIQRMLVPRGVYDSVRVRVSMLNPASTAFPAPEYVSAVQAWSRRGATIEREYLYVVAGRLMKVRASEPDRGDSESEAATFARQLFLAVR